MKSISKLLLFCFVLFFPYSYFISFGLLFFIVFVLIVYKLQSKSYFNFNIKDLYFLIIFLIDSFHLLSGNEELNSLIKTVLYPWIISLVFQNYSYTKKDIEQIVMLIGFSTFVVAVFIFFNQGGGTFDFSLNYILTRSRLGFIFTDPESPIGPTQISTMMAVSILSLFYSFKNNNRLLKIAFITMVLFLLLLVVLVSSRTTWVVLLMYIGVYLYYNKAKLLKFKNVVNLTFLIIIFSIVFLSVTPYIIYFRETELLNRFFGLLSPTEDGNFLSRVMRWNIAYKLILDKPFFGWGISYFSNAYNLQTTHNEFIGQTVGLGTIGISVWLFIYVYSLRKISVIKKYINKDLGVYFICFFIFLVLTGLTEHITLAMARLLNPLIWIFFGIVFSIEYDFRKIITTNKKYFIKS